MPGKLFCNRFLCKIKQYNQFLNRYFRCPCARRSLPACSSGLILGLFSTFFAEVVSASSPFVFFTAFGLIGTYLSICCTPWCWECWSSAVGRQCRCRRCILPGVLFGLYEAYITKVLWSLPWNTTTVAGGRDFAVGHRRPGGVLARVHVVHRPAYSPAELFLLRSNSLMRCLPEKWQAFLRRPASVWILAAVMGVWQGIAAGQWAVVSALVNSLVLLVFIALWKRLTCDQVNEWQAFGRPNRSEWTVLLVILLGYYLVFGFTVRQDAILGTWGQLTIWLMYAVWGTLLCLALKAAPVETEPVRAAIHHSSRAHLAEVHARLRTNFSRGQLALATRA